MVSTPAKPINKPTIIHLEILAHFESQILNNAMNSGTSEAMIAASPMEVYTIARPDLIARTRAAIAVPRSKSATIACAASAAEPNTTARKDLCSGKVT